MDSVPLGTSAGAIVDSDGARFPARRGDVAVVDVDEVASGRVDDVGLETRGSMLWCVASSACVM